MKKCPHPTVLLPVLDFHNLLSFQRKTGLLTHIPVRNIVMPWISTLRGMGARNGAFLSRLFSRQVSNRIRGRNSLASHAFALYTLFWLFYPKRSTSALSFLFATWALIALPVFEMVWSCGPFVSANSASIIGLFGRPSICFYHHFAISLLND